MGILYVFLDGIAKNITYFCGSVYDTTNSVPMKVGEVQDNINGEVRKVRFCQDDLCNSSRTLRQSVFLLIAAVLSLIALF